MSTEAGEVHSTLGLLDAMTVVSSRRLMFSSSATVYGDPHSVPIIKAFARNHTNPYDNIVYGNDYTTPDGIGVRDYIYVQDLAQDHVAAGGTCCTTAAPASP